MAIAKQIKMSRPVMIIVDAMIMAFIHFGVTLFFVEMAEIGTIHGLLDLDFRFSSGIKSIRI